MKLHRRHLVGFACLTLVFTSCAQREDVTAVHPHRATLLGPSKTNRKLYLHDKGRQGYFVLESEVVGYQSWSDGTQTANHYPADMILPAGTPVIVDRIDFCADMTAGPHTELIGRAFPRGGQPVKIFTLHELLRINIMKWQEEHLPFSFVPGTEEYLKRSRESEAEFW